MFVQAGSWFPPATVGMMNTDDEVKSDEAIRPIPLSISVKSLSGHTLIIQCTEQTTVDALKLKITEQALAELGETWPTYAQKLIVSDHSSADEADDEDMVLDDSVGDRALALLGVTDGDVLILLVEQDQLARFTY